VSVAELVLLGGKREDGQGDKPQMGEPATAEEIPW